MKILIPCMMLAVSLLGFSSGRGENPPNPKKDPMTPPSPQVECTIPILPVRNLARSVDFYTKTLGFQLDWGDAQKDTVCSVSRDGRPIMLLQQEKPGSPAWVWIGADEALFQAYRAKGVKVFQEPRNCSWAYEMKFEDPDGNILWLGSDPKRDQPFEDQKKNGPKG
jgi:predicted lactoylglutathione lyase